MHRTITTFTAIAVGLTLAASLTGCAKATTGSEPSPLVTTTVPAEPSMTPSDEPTAITSLADAELTTDSLGDVTVGQPVPADSALLNWTTGFCPPGSTGADSPTKEWVPTFRTEANPFPYFVWSQGLTAQDAAVGEIFLTSSEPRTADGIHVGSTIADVEAAGATHYDGAAPSGDDWYMLTGEDGQLMMRNTDGAIEMIVVQPVGEEPPGGFGLCD